MADKNQSERKPGWGAFVLSCLFWLPMLSGVLSRAIKHSAWFRDYEAVACSAEKLNQNAPIYDLHLACPGMHPTVFVYHPWVAETFAWVLARTGREPMLWGYAAVFAAAVAGLLWIIIGRAAPAPRVKRSWFAAFLTGSAIYWGNIGTILHALIGLCAVMLQRRPIVLVLAIAIAAVVKPVFLVFAVVFLLMPLPLWRRGVYAIAAVALGVAPTIYLLQFGGAYGAEWQALMHNFVFQNTGDGRPGDAFLGWLSAAGLPITGIVPALAYLAFAGAMSTAGLILAEGLKLDADRRVLLGLSLGVLLIPRLMSQDYWLLGPGLLAVSAAIGAQSRFGIWLERALLAICLLALIGNLADQADITNRVTTFLLTLTVFAATSWVVVHGFASPGPMWRRVWGGSKLAVTEG
ncbi:MAG: hypothetical protein ABUS57_01575 [Pseudomonadota bacterium]